MTTRNLSTTSQPVKETCLSDDNKITGQMDRYTCTSQTMESQLTINQIEFESHCYKNGHAIRVENIRNEKWKHFTISYPLILNVSAFWSKKYILLTINFQTSNLLTDTMYI